jgi:hypothetical protein
MTAILQLPAWLGSIVAMLVTIAASTLPFIIIRRHLRDDVLTKARDVTDTVAVRIGTVHSLILALVFADAQSTHTSLQQEVSKEIATIEHIVLELNQWNRREEEDSLRHQLAVYVRAILENEWHANSRPQGSREAARAYNDLDIGILNLRAATPQQESLRGRMIMNMDDLQDHRRARLALVHRGLPALFWWMALIGFAVIVGFFVVYPASLLHIAVLSVYSAYTGLALYFILALSHPYTGPAAIDTSPYEMVLDEDLRAPRSSPAP